MLEDSRPREAPSGLDEDAALRSILSGTAKETGERFFNALVGSLAEALGGFFNLMSAGDDEEESGRV